VDNTSDKTSTTTTPDRLTPRQRLRATIADVVGPRVSLRSSGGALTSGRVAPKSGGATSADTNPASPSTSKPEPHSASVPAPTTTPGDVRHPVAAVQTRLHDVVTNVAEIAKASPMPTPGDLVQTRLHDVVTNVADIADVAGASPKPTPGDHVQTRLHNVVTNVADIADAAKAPPKPTPGDKAVPRLVTGSLVGGQSVISDDLSTARAALSQRQSVSLPAVQSVSTFAPAPVSLLIRVLSTALAPFLATTPAAPADSPVLWGVLAWVRRQFEQKLLNDKPTLSWDGTTSQGIDLQTGEPVVTGAVIVRDDDSDTFSYTASDGVNGGTVDVDEQGSWTYTPPTGWNETPDFTDSFTITASDADDGPHLHGLSGLFAPDGGHTDTVTVNVSVAPPDGPVVKQPTPTGSGTYTTELKFTPNKYESVTANTRSGYWQVVPGTEHFDPETGQWTAEIKPTQAAELRQGLELETDYTLNLTATPAQPVQQQTVQTFALRAVGPIALAAAEEPAGENISVPLGAPPGAALQVDEAAISVRPYPAGVIVTDKYAYVLSFSDGSISVIGADPADPVTHNRVLDMDPSTPDVVDPIRQGGLATFGAVSGDRLYAATIGRGVDVINTTDNSVEDTIDVPGNGWAPIVSPDGNTLYVTTYGGDVYVVDISDASSPTYNQVIDLDSDAEFVQGIPIGPTPSGPYPDYYSAFSGGFGEDGILYLDRVRTSYVLDGQGEPVGTVISGDIIAIDPVTNTVVGQPLPLGEGYPGMLATDGKRLYVPVQYGFNPNESKPPAPSSLMIVDLASGTPVLVDVDPSTTEPDGIPVGTGALTVALSPDGSLAYVVAAGDGSIVVIDTVANEVLKTIPYGDPAQPGLDPSVVGISPDGKNLYISNYADGTVTAVRIVPVAPEV
jgi:YVTN family beta-propeller protein